MNRFRQQLRLAAGFLPYLRNPLTSQDALQQIGDRIRNREKRFLEMARIFIYENPDSPYAKLLQHSGCVFSDLVNSVRVDGLERTLQKLQQEGVFLTIDEFKSRTSIRRGNITIETKPSDFDNRYLMGRSVEARTSGSTGRPGRVLYDWNFFAEEAANELILHKIHGVYDLPQAFWYPGPPSISGLHNLLVHLKFRKPPLRWFSHLNASIASQAVLSGLSLCCRFFGVRVPLPETTGLDQAACAAEWMAAKTPCSLKTFTSSAVRVVQQARRRGWDIRGSVIFTGGEPLTAARKAFLESAGVRVYQRYVATEPGWIGAGCDKSDGIHLYTDRLAAIQKENKRKILFTTLSHHSGKILLNTDLGDTAEIRTADCDCLFGRAGMQTFLNGICNENKLTSEGMNVLASTMDRVIGDVITKLGGTPDDFQFWETESENGIVKIVIAVSPSVDGFNERYFRDQVMLCMQNEGAAGQVAAAFWRQGSTLQIVRAYPQLTAGYKHFAYAKDAAIEKVHSE